MTRRTDDRAETRTEEAAALLAEMRARVDDATRRLGDLDAELRASRRTVDELESLVDVLLGSLDAPALVIDGSRRVTGFSRAAGERFDGLAPGKAVSALLPGAVVDELTAYLDADGAEAALPAAGEGARAYRLPGGGAVVLLPAR